jgi:positive phototaxis protein PixI
MTAVKTGTDLVQFLSFQLPPDTGAMLPTHQLVEITTLHLSQVVPIPDVSPALLGVCNWRGEVLWLADLGLLLGFEPLYTHSLQKGQVNTIIIQRNGRMLGLGVEQVNQMVWCDRAQIQPAHMTHLSALLTRCLQGYWTDPQNKGYLVLDGEAILNSLT